MDTHALVSLLRDAATLIDDLRNGYAEKELHRSPDDWKGDVETLFNMNGMTLTDG